MAKYAFLGRGEPDASLLALDIDEQVATCASIKAAVVAADETEQGGRMVLNYGHTLAHALEAEAFDDGPGGLAHGEAVAIGLVFSALLARRLGRIGDDRVELHRRVVAGFDLVANLPAHADPARLVAAMGRDKKARHDLTFVLDGPNGVELVSGVGQAHVLATLAEMGSSR
jgi:5-deoxy-5-amino-3-dehydroquinate synthase